MDPEFQVGLQIYEIIWIRCKFISFLLGTVIGTGNRRGNREGLGELFVYLLIQTKIEAVMSIKSMPVWKWVALLVVSVFLSLVMYGLAQTVVFSILEEWVSVVVSILLSGAMLGLYALFVRWFEKASPRDLPLRRLAPDTGKGLGVGAGYFVVLVAVMFAAGLDKVASVGTEEPFALVASFFMFLVVAVGEEIIFRGVIFRWIDEKWGFPIALGVSSALFGLVHIAQPEATWWSSLAIAVEAGLLLGAAYKYAGTLWLPVGIHWAWNFTQGNIFGFAVSGAEAGPSLIRSSVEGPVILTGGAFGAEASLLALLLGLLLSVWFIVKIYKRA